MIIIQMSNVITLTYPMLSTRNDTFSAWRLKMIAEPHTSAKQEMARQAQLWDKTKLQ